MKNFILSTCVRPLLLLLPLSLHAGFMKEWQLKETSSAPVLVTARVLGVHRNERVSQDQVPWKAETWSMTADVEVLRFFTASGLPLTSHYISMHFLAYGPSVTGFVNGTPPPLPNIAAGEIRILPLQENSNPAAEPWRLMADSGADITIPVRAEVEGEAPQSPSGRVFLMRELANTMSGGSPGEISALSGYLSRQMEDLSGELMPILSLAIGGDRSRWAEIAASLHAALGIPRPTIADLITSKPEESKNPGPSRGNLPLLRAALRKLEASPATDELLIKTWIANAPLNAWGSANSLVEYADNPITTQSLLQALRSDLHGTSYIALVLANHGNKAILADAVARAFRVIDDPKGMGSDFSEVQGAAALLRDYGSNLDLTRLAAIVRKYQTLDPKYYGLLWQDATGSDNPREMAVLAVVLADHRIASGNMRYCDYALGEFNRLTKQELDIGAASIPERDAAILRAREQIKIH